ncbi:MAG: thiamine pyrophosphate-binding protein [Alphaproteobacteria bacterium]
MNDGSAEDWPRDIFEALEAADVGQIAYVPDAGHKELILRCAAARGMRMVPLTTEEEGVALLAGAWLGGQRGVLLMQSSGLGNCINMLSLTRVCRFPLLILVTMRGEAGEFNPWQLPMGENAAELLRLTGVAVSRADKAEEVGPAVAEAARAAFEGPGGEGPAATAVLIAQKLVGIKTFDAGDGR